MRALIIVFLAAAIASLAGCPAVAIEAQYHCFIGGADWGPALSGMTLMIWAELFSLPVGGIALLIWAVIALNAYMKHRFPPLPGA